MDILAVDDEEFVLRDLEQIIQEVAPDARLHTTRSAEEALIFAAKTEVKVALLDIEMTEMNGLELAKRLKDILPEVRIIFVTGYSRYAVDAFALHAVGYLLKPVQKEDLKRELSFVYAPEEGRKHIRVQTFGGFEIYVDGNPVVFKRSKSKELLAYLIDRRGVSITTREACAILWEDEAYDTARKNYFHIILMELRAALRREGIEDILVKRRNSLAIDPARLDCDSYNFMNGDIRAINSYRRDYMLCYSWAEFSMGHFESLGKKY